MFASEEIGVEPDILTLAKGIANGFPLSAFTTRPEIGESFLPGDHFSTFGGNLVSAAAAIATIGYLEREQVPAHARRLGRNILSELETWRNAHPLIGDVRGKGLMIGIELVIDQETKIPAADEAKRVQEECRKRVCSLGAADSTETCCASNAACHHAGTSPAGTRDPRQRLSAVEESSAILAAT